jgi:hypothetical protein
MFSTQYIFLLLVLTCYVTIITNQNEVLPLTKNYKIRIKRMLFDKSSKSRVKKKERNNIFDEDILFSANKDESQPRSDTRKGYTLQELAEIQRILSKKEDDYYGILNIDKQATGDIINIAYRKLTLRVHPDKFNVSGATEATQKLNKARNELLKKYTDQNKGMIF